MKDQFEPFIDCRLCGDRISMIGFTKLCDRCWEIESRIFADPELARKILASIDREEDEGDENFDPATTDAIRSARKILALNPVFLDTETTGLGNDAEIIDIALIDSDGIELINTLVRPTAPIPAEATNVHGITNEDVVSAPTFAEVLANLESYSDRVVVIYNRDYDLRLCRQSAKAHGVENWRPAETICAMQLYAEFYGDWNDYHKSYRWQSQEKAARQLDIKIPDDLHRAAADAQLCRLIVEAMAAIRLPGESRNPHITL